ncbi:hypothetical protein KH172YL63_01690 [Bacillus sp. KH172YL63]|nr:hypothetical protein KH172YL63_01690 [Bacillus sp. KH172YL63]
MMILFSFLKFNGNVSQAGKVDCKVTIYKAPGLDDGYEKDHLVDEVEVYRAFGGCLPVRTVTGPKVSFLKR